MEGHRLLEEGAKEFSSSIANSSALIDAANTRTADLQKKLEVSEADLQKMKELYSGAHNKYKGLESQLTKLQGHMDELK